jgi:hypothetical protein
MRTQSAVRAENFQPQRFAKIASAATLALALTFTLSCSGDPENNGGGGLNLSNLPKQAYLVEYDNSRNEYVTKKYDGSGDIKERLCIRGPKPVISCEESVSKQMGKIQNGQVLLDLPDIESKYLRNLENPCSDIDDKECKVIFPKNVDFFKAEGFNVTITDKGDCELDLNLVGEKDEHRGWMFFYYFSKPGKIDGTVGDSNFDDWNFSAGWSTAYIYRINADDRDYKYLTTDLSKTGGKLEWRIRNCN